MLNQTKRIPEMPSANVVCLAKSIFRVLNTQYPLYKDWWNVQIDTIGGVVNVRNMMLSGKMGFIVLITEVTDKEIMRLAGELLERYRCPRAATSRELIDVLRSMRLNSKGEAIYDG